MRDTVVAWELRVACHSCFKIAEHNPYHSCDYAYLCHYCGEVDGRKVRVKWERPKGFIGWLSQRWRVVWKDTGQEPMPGDGGAS